MKQIEIENSLNLRSQNRKQCADRFSIQELVMLIDKNLLLSIENIYRLREDGLDLLEFTRFFMNCIEHNEKESPYLAAGLEELYQAISNGDNKVKFSQFTDFICQQILQKGGLDKDLEAKWIPIKGHVQQKLSYLRNPPILKGHLQQIYKASLDKQNIDNSKHQNIISHACYSLSNKNMYCLQSLADWIGVYNSNSKLEKVIKPSALRAKKDLAVISICYSQNEERLGAVLKDFSISFWDVSDNFTFQKSINTTKYCQQLQNNIWYLEFFQKWITTGIDGKIYIWNLLKQMPSKILLCANKSKISDICQIPSISVLAVAQQQRGNHTQTAKIQLLSLQKGELVAQIDTKVERRMLHTLKYSEDYQMLLTAGYEKKISIFQINNVFLDSSLRGQLLGHQSAITTFAIIKRAPIVVSADDKGKVKIWNIRNFKCVQTIDFSDKVVITKILDMAIEKKICLMGSRIILLNLQKQPETIEEVVPLKAKFLADELAVTTSHDFRKIDIKSGKLKVIDCSFNKSVTDITYTTMLSRGQVITGNEKGEINFYCKNRGKIVQTAHWHSGTIQSIQQDIINRQLLTYSDHSGFIIIGKNHDNWQILRELSCSFVGKEATAIALSSYHQIIGFISSQIVNICEYQQLKIQHRFIFEGEEPTALNFINGLGIILISTSIGRIYVYEIEKDALNYRLHIECSRKYITHLTYDLKCQQINNLADVNSCQIACSFVDGAIQVIDFTHQAKRIFFKPHKIEVSQQNKSKQVRQSFQNQLRKCLFKQIFPHSSNNKEFQGVMKNLAGHKYGITSIQFAQFDEPLLISAGNDKRIKLWKGDQLVGDININLPLPYLWKLESMQEKKTKKRILQGLELIQILFKRFGKDISLGQAQIFKLASAPESQFDAERRQTKKNLMKRLKKKPTLFQDEFSEIDLNYDKIKKEKLLQLGGPSLKKMELAKKIENLQKDWQIAKLAQQVEKKSLLNTILLKAQKIDQKQKIEVLLKGKPSVYKQKQKAIDLPLKNLKQKLQAAIQANFPEKDGLKTSPLSKVGKEPLLRFSCQKLKGHRKSASKQTLQSYFAQKYKQVRQMSQTTGFKSNRTRNSESCTNEKENSFFLSIKKESNFRIILKELKQKLSRSKKGDLQRPTTEAAPSTLRRQHQETLSLNKRQLVNENEQKLECQFK